MHASVQQQLIDLESYLSHLSSEELRVTASMHGVNLVERREVLVNVPHTKDRLVELCIEAEEKQIAQRRGVGFFVMSDLGKEIWAEKTLRELKINARYLGVPLTQKTYRIRLTKKTDRQIKYELLYETDLYKIF